jgi:hypothetical protein
MEVCAESKTSSLLSKVHHFVVTSAGMATSGSFPIFNIYINQHRAPTG